jgi:hypothetical protein
MLLQWRLQALFIPSCNTHTRLTDRERNVWDISAFHMLDNYVCVVEHHDEPVGCGNKENLFTPSSYLDMWNVRNIF